MSLSTVTILDAGYCSHPEHVIHQNRKFSSLRFPSMFAVIEHPSEGVILYDTGYSKRFQQATNRFPERFYAMVTPVSVTEQDVAVYKLAQRGIRPSDVRYVICSHFHADHVSALADFPCATYVFLAEAWEAVRHLRGIRGILRAYLPALIPDDFEARARPLDVSQSCELPPECAPFRRGIDLFSDGSVYGVPLPGHAAGQLGLYVPTQEKPYFFVADACWTSESIRRQLMPHPITRLLFQSYAEYGVTLGKIGELYNRNSNMEIVPSHCDELISRLIESSQSE